MKKFKIDEFLYNYYNKGKAQTEQIQGNNHKINLFYNYR